jgi:hypothetical protein
VLPNPELPFPEETVPPEPPPLFAPVIPIEPFPPLAVTPAPLNKKLEAEPFEPEMLFAVAVYAAPAPPAPIVTEYEDPEVTA